MTQTRVLNRSALKTDERVYVSPKTDVDLNEIIKKYNSLGQYLLNKLKDDFANETILTDFGTGRQWKGAQLYKKILNISAALVDKYGLKPGAVACIAYDNTDKTQILAIGLICAGAIVACSYPKDPYPQLLYLARKVDPKFLFCHDKNRVKWANQLSIDLGHHVHAISMDGPNEDGFDNLDSLLNYDRSLSKAIIPHPIKDLKKHVAIITMSSGTTGNPKAVPCTHWNCLFELLYANINRGIASYKGINFACCSSLDYVSGRMIVLGAMNSGYNAVILNGFEPESYAMAIERFRINMVYLVFPMGAKVIFLKELSEFFELHPNIKKVRQGFGASEIGGAAINSLSPGEYLKDCENCGTLMPGVMAKIVDSENGKLLGANQVGIVHIKSETLFPGYYDLELMAKRSENYESNGYNEEEEPPFVWDSNVFDEDHYYITGDLGYFNDKEELYIIGRQKELMSCRGAKKVLPQELEEVLDKHPAVSKVCVLGVPSKIDILQHCPRAFVVPKLDYVQQPELIDQLKATRPKVETLNDELDQETRKLYSSQGLKCTGNPLSDVCSLAAEWRSKLAADLMNFVNERVGWEKHLTGGIVLLDEIPTSRATGKMDKNYLRSLTLERIEIYGDQSC